MEKVAELLKALALELGTTVEHLWGVLVRQAFFAGIMDSIYIVLLGIYLGFWWKIWLYIKGCSEERDRVGYGNNMWVSAYVGHVVLGLAVVLLLLPQAIYGVLYEFGNPEYFALNKILTLLKSK